jgi:hypothetical protein
MSRRSDLEKAFQPLISDFVRRQPLHRPLTLSISQMSIQGDFDFFLLMSDFSFVVLPAKAGIHFGPQRMRMNGFPLSRE